MYSQDSSHSSGVAPAASAPALASPAAGAALAPGAAAAGGAAAGGAAAGGAAAGGASVGGGAVASWARASPATANTSAEMPANRMFFSLVLKLDHRCHCLGVCEEKLDLRILRTSVRFTLVYRELFK